MGPPMKFQIDSIRVLTGPPDDDGDYRFRSTANLTVVGEGVVDRIEIATILRSPAGLPLIVENTSSHDLYLEDTESTEVDDWGYNKTSFEGCIADIGIFGFMRESTPLGTAPVPSDNEPAGEVTETEIGGGILLTSWAVVRSPPDSDGAINLRFMLLAHNASDQPRRVGLRARLLDRGRKEIYTTEDSEQLLPGRTGVIETTAYLKTNQLKKASMELGADVFSQVCEVRRNNLTVEAVADIYA